MSDIELTNISSGYNLGKINENFDKVEAVVNDDVMHLEGDNNIMRQNLDMNGKRILNLPTPVLPTDVVRLQDIALVTSDFTASDLYTTFEDGDVGDVVQVTGFYEAGDGGDGLWVKTAETGTAGQKPEDTGDATIVDASGAVWRLIHNGTIHIESIGGKADIDNGPVYLAYAGSTASMLDLSSQSWPCPSINVSDGTARDVLLANPVKNGALNCENSFENVSKLRTSSLYSEDDITTTQTKSPIVEWDGRTVLWLGTSIPHFGAGSDGYPEQFAKRLNCNVLNWAWSGSHAFYDINGDAFNAGTVRGLSMTDADLAAGLALYGSSSAYDDSFNAVTLASEMTTEYRIKAQFEANPEISVVMLDHNHNDRLNEASYTTNIKTISAVAVGTTTTVTVDDTSGLAVGDGCYLRVEGVDNLEYAAGRIQSISSLDVVVAIDSTGYTGAFTSGTLVWVDRNTVAGAWDFLIAYIKNMSIVNGDGSVEIILCNSPSNFTNNANPLEETPDYTIWSNGRAIKAVADNWELAYFDVANDLALTYRDHLKYLPDAVHPTTTKTRTVFTNHWVEWAAGGAVPHLRHAEFIQAKETIPHVHQEVALYSKYDDKYAPRMELFSLDDPLLIDEDFSGTLASWTTTGVAPTIVTAPWDAGEFAIRCDVTSSNAATRINQLQAIGHDGYLSFDLWLPSADLATGTSNQMTIAALVTGDATIYNLQIIQTVGGSPRFAVSRVEGGVTYLTIKETLLEANTKYNIVFDVIKGTNTSDDGGLYLEINGDVKYSGDWENGGIASVTGLQIGSVFTNMSNDYLIYIGNIKAGSKSRTTTPSYSEPTPASISSQYTTTDVTVYSGPVQQTIAVDNASGAVVTIDPTGWSAGDIVRIAKVRNSGVVTINTTQDQLDQANTATTSYGVGTTDQTWELIYTGSEWRRNNYS